MAQAQVLAQAQFLRRAHQVALAHQVRPRLRQLPFTELRVAGEQLLAGHEAQHGVAQELQLLVVAQRHGGLRLLLARVRAVRDRLLQQLGSSELVSKGLFQPFSFSAFHSQNCVPACRLAWRLPAETDRTTAWAPPSVPMSASAAWPAPTSPCRSPANSAAQPPLPCPPRPWRRRTCSGCRAPPPAAATPPDPWDSAASPSPGTAARRRNSS